MNVSELIAELRKCDPKAPVVFFSVPWGRGDVQQISPEDSDGNVVLGYELPAEMYARDYKYD